MEQQPQVRKVMRPLKSPNITLAQAKRVFREIMREEREAEERKKAEQRARASEREVPEAEA
ncbi:MAG TPA: hypothetical protein VFS20_12535 [Longimicrobium sp.]|nr:hypothetical protein [Longimicrobium sp.]